MDSKYAQRDWVFVSLEEWDEIWRRNQFLCSGFLENGMARRILFVEPPRVLALWLKNRLRGRKAAFEKANRPSPTQFAASLRRFAPLQLLPNTLAPFRRFNQWHETQQVRREARKFGVDSPVLWINNHWSAPLVGKLGESAVLYDITDDWLSFEKTPSRRERLQALDAFLCANADATIVCSPQLQELKAGKAKRLELVPNGVDATHYARVSQSIALPHPIACDWGQDVLGYVGTIHPDRVDLKLVEAIARKFSQSIVALVGPLMISEAQKASLLAFPNIRLTGPVPYQDVPDVMRAFSVCLVPHVETAFTQSLNPIKLGEYLAAGLPIVSTNVAGFAEIAAQENGRLCWVVSGEEAFMEACLQALYERGDDQQFAWKSSERRALARTMSWTARLQHVATILDSIAAIGK